MEHPCHAVGAFSGKNLAHQPLRDHFLMFHRTGIGRLKPAWVYLKKCLILNPAHPECKECSVWMQDEQENDPRLGTVLKRQPSHSLHARKPKITPLIMFPSSEALSSKRKCMKSLLTQSIILQVQEVICIMLFGRKGYNDAVPCYYNHPYKLDAPLIHCTVWPTRCFVFLPCTPAAAALQLPLLLLYCLHVNQKSIKPHFFSNKSILWITQLQNHDFVAAKADYV